MLAPAPAATVGRSSPRIAPPRPLRSSVEGLEKTALDIGLRLLPWQRTVGEYLEALTADDLWLYPEVAAIVARQNGKTEMFLPHVKRRLGMGRRVLHLAQTRELPRRLFNRLTPLIERDYPDAKIRRGAGQEMIELSNGGSYLIAAATGGGARGVSVDDLLVDEVRELDEDVVGAALPTISASLNPQVVYASNAGHDGSDVLNAIRARAGVDPSLAYLEWSADPERDPGDVDGWAEANPSLSHFPALMGVLERAHRSAILSGQMAIFETEHLCRWVPTMRPRLIDEVSWMRCKSIKVSAPTRAYLGISMDPSGTRASIVMAWRQPDKTIALRELFDVPGEPIDTDALGEDAVKVARKHGAIQVGYDDWTDRDLARHFKGRAKSIIGKDFANASEAFVRAVSSGQVRYTDAVHITEDLKSTSRKENDEMGTFHAVRSRDDVSVTASLAAIRAFWLASGSTPTGSLKVY